MKRAGSRIRGTVKRVSAGAGAAFLIATVLAAGCRFAWPGGDAGETASSEGTDTAIEVEDQTADPPQEVTGTFLAGAAPLAGPETERYQARKGFTDYGAGFFDSQSGRKPAVDVNGLEVSIFLDAAPGDPAAILVRPLILAAPYASPWLVYFRIADAEVTRVRAIVLAGTVGTAALEISAEPAYVPGEDAVVAVKGGAPEPRAVVAEAVRDANDPDTPAPPVASIAMGLSCGEGRLLLIDNGTGGLDIAVYCHAGGTAGTLTRFDPLARERQDTALTLGPPARGAAIVAVATSLRTRPDVVVADNGSTGAHLKFESNAYRLVQNLSFNHSATIAVGTGAQTPAMPRFVVYGTGFSGDSQRGVKTIYQIHPNELIGAEEIALTFGLPTDEVYIGSVSGAAYPEVVRLEDAGKQLRIFTPSGDFRYGPGTEVAIGLTGDARDLRVADLDGDGQMEMIKVHNLGGVDTVIAHSTGSKGWNERNLYSDPGGRALALRGIADANGDGRQDLVLIVGGELVAITQGPDGTMATPLPLQAPGTVTSVQVVSGPIDDDARPDLVLLGDQGMTVWFGGSR